MLIICDSPLGRLNLLQNPKDRPCMAWPIVRDLVDDAIIVDDKEIVKAMRLCYEILKVAVEPSGAIGLAAVLSDDFRNNSTWKTCNNVGIIISGGNVDLDSLWNSFTK